MRDLGGARGRQRLALVAVAVLVGLPLVRGYAKGLAVEWTRPEPDRFPRAVVDVVPPGETVFTDLTTTRDLRFFWGYEEPNRVRHFEDDDPESLPSGTFVLVHRDRLEFLERLYDRKPPRFVDAIPAEWELYERLPGGEVYRVSRDRPTGDA